MEFDQVKIVDDCIETATLDAYGEDEQASGWLACLEEIFADVKEVRLLGEPVKMKGLDLAEHQVVAVCSKRKLSKLPSIPSS